jgi:hypothetical protein
MAKARGLFPATRLKVSSAAAGPEPRLRGMDAEPEPRPPRERRPAVPGPGPDGRCGGGRGKEWGRLAPVPRPATPPPRASFDEPPYIERERPEGNWTVSSLRERQENKSGLFVLFCFVFFFFFFHFSSFFFII